MVFLLSPLINLLSWFISLLNYVFCTWCIGFLCYISNVVALSSSLVFAAHMIVAFVCCPRRQRIWWECYNRQWTYKVKQVKHIEDPVNQLIIYLGLQNLIKVWLCFCRWPCTRSYADTVKAFEDQNSSESVTVNETPSNISNGKHLPKKNG